MASSPLGLKRLKGRPPTPANPMLAGRTVSMLAEEAWTLELATEPPGPGRISGNSSLAGGTDTGLVAEGAHGLAVWGLVGVVGLVRPRLARASRVPSGSTMTFITKEETGRCWLFSVVQVGKIQQNCANITNILFYLTQSYVCYFKAKIFG